MENKTKYKAKSARKPLLKEETLKRLIAALIIVVLAISVVGYFVYFTGLPARVLTGAEIYRTNSDGTVERFQSVRVTEINYYYSAVYNQYYQAGLISDSIQLDEPLGENEDGSFTFRDVLYDTAGETMMMAHLTYRAAMEREDFVPLVTDVLSEYTVNLLRQNASSYGITVDDLLQNLYGRGMTLRTYMRIVEKELIVEEFREFLRQNDFFPTHEEVEAFFNEDPSDYLRANFNYYMFPVDVGEGATEEQIAEAFRNVEEAARFVESRSIHAAAFRDAVIETLGPDAGARFADGRDPTIYNDYTKAMTDRVNPQLAQFVFDPLRQVGDTSVFIDERGAHVVFFGTVDFDRTATASYRTLFIENPNPQFDDEDALAQDLVDQAQTIIDAIENEQDFIYWVKTTSDDIDRRNSGGLVSGVREDDLANPDAMPADYDIEFAAWLFSEDRQEGDMYILETPFGVSVVYFRDNLPAYLNAARENFILERREEWEEMVNPEGVYDYVIIKRNVDFARY